MPNSENPIMQYFTYAHLPKNLKGVSHVIANTAKLLNTSLSDGPEKTTGLRKLLEAKDCFVRHAVNSPTMVNSGQLSDGFHSFNELYAHRMQLFAVICHQNQPHAWKSKLHDDGAMYEDYFIVGIETPMGQFSYHYNIAHWGVFDVKELDKAPKWDCHTADDVVRLHSLDGHIMQYVDNPNTPEQPHEMTTINGKLNLSSYDGYSRLEVRKKAGIAE